MKRFEPEGFQTWKKFVFFNSKKSCDTAVKTFIKFPVDHYNCKKTIQKFIKMYNRPKLLNVLAGFIVGSLLAYFLVTTRNYQSEEFVTVSKRKRYDSAKNFKHLYFRYGE